MANVKITELTAATALAATDVLPIVDVGADATKKVSVSDLLRNVPDGTASAPALAFADDQNTGILSPAENELAFATTGTQRLVIDGSGRVGIGTASPGNTLHLKGAQGVGIRFENSTSGNSSYLTIESGDKYQFNVGGSGYYTWVTGGSEKVRIDSSGRVGIGTTSPGQLLQVGVPNSATASFRAGTSLVSIDAGYQSSNVIGTAAAPALIFGGDSNTGYWHPASDTLAVSTAGSEKLRISSAGNVGIGDSSPSHKLVVKDAGASNTSNYLNVISGNAANAGIAFGDTDTDLQAGILYLHSDNALRFFKSGFTEAARIDSSGNIGIGTSSPAAKLDVNGEVFFSTNTAGKNTHTFTTNASNDGRYLIKSDTTTKVDIQANGASFFNGGNVGIGTTNPSVHLHVSSGSTDAPAFFDCTNSNGPHIRFLQNGSAKHFLGCGGGISLGDKDDFALRSFDNILFATNDSSTERMRIDSSGRLLVGASSSADQNAKIQASATAYEVFEGFNYSNDAVGSIIRLAKSRNTSIGSQTIVQNGDELGRIAFLGTDGGNYRNAARISTFVDGTPGSSDMPGRLAFYTSADGSSSPTERLRIDSSGNIGIGTTSPGEKLDVNGNIRVGANQRVMFGPDGFEAGIKYATDATLQIASRTSENIAFTNGNDGAERMKIMNDGQLRTLASQTAFLVSSATGAGTSEYLIGGQYSASSPGLGTNSFRVYTNGNVQNTNNSYGQISDAKLKENIVSANSQWDDIKAVQVRNFNFKEETNNPTHTQIGVVAQEIETVSPGLVYETPDRDAEGEDLGTVTKSVNYSVLYMKAVKALQEAMDRIETLETKVAALEAQ